MLLMSEKLLLSWASYLHTEAGLGPSEGQNLDFDPLAFVDHIGHVSHTALSAKLGDVDQPLPSFSAEKGLVRTDEGLQVWGRRPCSLTVSLPAERSSQTA